MFIVTAGLALPVHAASANPSRVPSHANVTVATRSLVYAETNSGAEPPDTAVDLSCSKPAVVKPNCGVKPQQAGDRGGALQYTVWGLLIVGLIIIFTVVFRSAARTNRRKTNEVAGRDWS